MAPSEETLLAFLKTAASYPDHPVEVRVIQTHASYLAITDTKVYKVKKPVNLGFLDFSTLEKREYFMHREMELNRRLAPDLYIQIHEIRIRDGVLSFGGDGEVVDYALEMHRMSDEDFFPELLKHDRITDEDLAAIVTLLARFYRSETSSPEIAQWGHPEKLKISTDENFAQVAPFAGETISEEALQLTRRYTDRFYDLHLPLFEKRVSDGWILNCHGDLHLDHLHRHNGKWHIYDCIEFNDRFRYVDVANDTAFLAMDLDYNRRQKMSRQFVALLQKHLPDPDRNKLFDFYKCYRAFVRGKVESMIAADPHVDSQAAEIAKGRARSYFSLATRYALLGSKPLVVVVMGMVASGKSNLAVRLSSETGVPLYRCDVIRKELAGIPIEERGDEESRKRLYAADMTERTYNQIFESLFETVQKEQMSAVIDCTFSKQSHRAALVEHLAKERIRCRFVLATAPEPILLERLKRRGEKQKVVSDARLEDYAKIVSSYEPPVEIEDLITIDTSGPRESSFLELGLQLVERTLQSGGR